MQTSIERSVADDGAAVITVAGQIDFTNARQVSECLLLAIAEWKPPAVRVDLRDAQFIDSTGLGSLVAGYRAASELHSTFVVVNANPRLRRVLFVTGLGDLFGLPPEQPSAAAR